MYMREQERARRESTVEGTLAAAEKAAWGKCADASRVLLVLRKEPQFRKLVRGHPGLLEVLPATLANSMSSKRAHAMLTLVVARLVLRPLLVRVEVLGWLARTYPDSLVTLLEVAAGDDAYRPSEGPALALDALPTSRRRSTLTSRLPTSARAHDVKGRRSGH